MVNKKPSSETFGKSGESGLLEVFTGDGKGKTSAALGIALRALGHNLRVYIVYFMKGGHPYGEHQVWSQLGDDLAELIHDNGLIDDAFTEFDESSKQLDGYLEDHVLASINMVTSEAAANASSATSTADKWLLALGITGLVAGLTIAWIMSRRISKPVAELIKGAQIVSSGKIEHRFDIEPKDELGELGSALNKMLNNLHRSKEALGESEETAWALLDSTTDSVILTDLRGIILASNEIAAERFDKSLEQMIDGR